MPPSNKKAKSTIEWVVFKPEQVEEARKIMKDLRGDSTLDAMGFGALFEPISDRLFPGTSTLHTWLRYQIFVPSIIYSLNDQKKLSTEAASELKNLEYKLQRLLVTTSHKQKEKTGEDTMGIIGRSREEQIKYWPSMIYWSSLNILGVWGEKPVSREQVLSLIEKNKEGAIINDDEDQEVSLDEDLYICEDLYQIANEFIFKDISAGKLPEQLDFKLTRKEGQYFKKRYKENFADSLVSYLIDLNVSSVEKIDSLFMVGGIENKKLFSLIENAKKYSFLAQGGTYLYNSILCGDKNRDEAKILNIQYLQKWLNNIEELISWDIDELYEALRKYGGFHEDKKLQDLKKFTRFIKNKFIAERDAEKLISREEVIKRVREREFEVKGNRSRFENSSIRIPMRIFQDNGYQDYLYDYRWDVGKQNALDVIRGLNRQC